MWTLTGWMYLPPQWASCRSDGHIVVGVQGDFANADVAVMTLDKLLVPDGSYDPSHRGRQPAFICSGTRRRLLASAVWYRDGTPGA